MSSLNVRARYQSLVKMVPATRYPLPAVARRQRSGQYFDNPTAAYSTADYYAITLLHRQAGKVEATCPAGIARVDDGQASLTITSPAGDAFTVNFMNDYVNAAGKSVVARFEVDT